MRTSAYTIKAGLFASILTTRLQNIPVGKDSELPRIVARAAAICAAARTAAEGFQGEEEQLDLSDQVQPEPEIDRGETDNLLEDGSEDDTLGEDLALLAEDPEDGVA